jgi:hypothetical protein
MERMKRIAAATAIVCIAVIVAACGANRTVVNETPIDVSYTPAHDSIETTTKYVVDLLGDESLFKLMPDTHTVHYPDKYEIEYRREYDNGDTDTYWKEVERDEYERIADMLDE